MTCTCFLYFWLDQVARSGAHATQGLGYQEVRCLPACRSLIFLHLKKTNRRKWQPEKHAFFFLFLFGDSYNTPLNNNSIRCNMHLSMRGYVLTTDLSGPFNFSVSQWRRLNHQRRLSASHSSVWYELRKRWWTKTEQHAGDKVCFWREGLGNSSWGNV